MEVKKKKKWVKYVVIIISLLLIIGIGIGAYYGYKYYKKENMISTANLYFTGLEDTKQIGRDKSDIEYNGNCSHVIIYPEIGNEIIDGNISKYVSDLKESFINEFGKLDDGTSKISYYQYVNYETYLGVDNTMSVVFYEAISSDSKITSNRVYTFNISLNTGEILKDSYFFVDGYEDVITKFVDNYLSNDVNYKELLNENYKDLLNSYHYAVATDNIYIYYDEGKILPKSSGIISILLPYNEIKDYMGIDTTKKADGKIINAGVLADATIYTDCNTDMFVKSIINVYDIDSRNGEKIGTLNQGNLVKVIRTSDTGWSEITYDSKTAYVVSSFLSSTPVAIKNFSSVNEKVYAISAVNVRSEANTDSTILGKLDFKNSVTRIGVNDSWSEVLYNDQIAYIFSSYLSTTEPSYASANIPIDPTRNINPNKPMVALTFDDGPNPYSTPRILNTLEKYNSVATFFDLGYLITSYPKIVQREEAIGCEVGSHTYSHKDLTTLSVADLKTEMTNSENSFISVLGHKPNLVRPPYGSVNATVKSNINYPLINWDVDTLDWKNRNKDSILNEINKYSSLDGKIILMHSIYGTTADAVEELVPQLISRGYQLVTVPELAKYKGYTLDVGKLYYDFR